MNRFKVFGIVAMVASIWLLMTSCMTAGDRAAYIASLVGTWSNEWDTLVLNDNRTFHMTWSYGDGGEMSGTFTANSHTISLTPTGGWRFSGSYSVVGNNLRISIPAWEWNNATLFRHEYFVGTWANAWDTMVLNPNGTFQMTWTYGNGGQISGIFVASGGDISLMPHGGQMFAGTYSIIDDMFLRISVPDWQWNNAILSRQ